jgi:hypothetical protein
MTSFEAIELYGTDEPVPESRRLRAGALTCRLTEGQVAEVAWNGVELLRGIAYLFRDGDWGTPPAVVRALDVRETVDGFVATFELEVATTAGTLRGAARIEGRADGRFAFDVTATTDADLATNRCGFVVLHPASVAGRALRIEHADGTIEATTFPERIRPSQPALAIRSLRYSPVEGVGVDCRLEAELPHDPSGKFEMEDQRNWSDASFKTYVASLLDPWPYVLPAGRPMSQRVVVQAHGEPAATATATARDVAPVLVRFGEPVGASMPHIGIGIPPGLARARAQEIEALRDLDASWWVAELELELDDPRWSSDLAALAAHRRGTRARVQLDIVAPDALDPEQAAALAASAADRSHLVVDAIRFLPASLLKSYQPSDRWPVVFPPDAYAHAARARFPTAQIGGGMFTCFTELNRARPSGDGLDFIGYATCPIVHAADDASVMQTLETLPHIVQSAKALWPARNYRLGPSAIGMRRNPYGEAPAANPHRGRVAMATLDPRHGARFGDAWLVAYAARTIPLGLDVLSLLESHGPRGPLRESLSGPRDGVARAAPAAATRIPAWQSLARLANARGAPVVPLLGLPRQVAGIAWRIDEATIECLLANTSAAPCDVHWSEPVRIDGTAAATRLELGPHQVVDVLRTSERPR